MPTLYLIDGSAYVYRAYHAIRGLSNSSGLPTNAVFGFTKMILKLKEDKSPEYWAVCFDVKGPTFRHEMYDQYKANRPPMPEDLSVQIPYIKKISKAFSIPVVEKQGYEGDDLMGTLKRRAEDAGFSVVLVTGDKDFLQLVSEKSMILDPMKDKLIDLDGIRDTHGLEPRQMQDVMSLTGDKADNIEGVPGIGPKTANTLIREHGSIESLYAGIEKISKKKLRENLKNFKERVFLNKRLVTIDTNVDIESGTESFRMREPDVESLTVLLKELEFKALLKTFAKKGTDAPQDYKTILENQEFERLVKRLEESARFAVDTETTSENPMLAKLVGISFSMNPGEAFYIPLAHSYIGVPVQLESRRVLDALKPILENEKIRKIGQNIKYDMIVLARCGIEMKGVWFDTMLASYLLDPSARTHGLEQIAFELFNYKMMTFKEVAGGKNNSFATVPVERASFYSCEDADITLRACETLAPAIEAAGLEELFFTMEMPLVKILADMEMQGVCVDIDRLAGLSANFGDRLKDLEKTIYEVAGEKFNIRSAQQLGVILFEKMQLQGRKKAKKTRKTGAWSTDARVLADLAATHEFPALILEHRTVAKLKSTYADALAGLANRETGRIHTSFNQSVTATGRLSSSNPNLQNIPVRTEDGRDIRRAFIPRDGWLLLAVDYSQIELRMFAHFSEDEILTESFLKDEDVHTRTASEVFGLPAEEITPDLRRRAKTINFGIIYGMGSFKLSQELSISGKAAKHLIESYFSRYRGVRAFIDNTIEQAGRDREVRTLSGRLRRLPDINSPNSRMRSIAERTAVNTVIQGSAADIIKLAMISVARELKRENLRSAMLLSVHDELIFEVPPDEKEIAMRVVRDAMEGVLELKVPLKVDAGAALNWAAAH